MATPTHNISVLSTGEIVVQEPVLPKRYVGWYCLHAIEGGFYNPVGMPAVRRDTNAPPVEMNKYVQLMSYDLNEGRITKQKWRVLYGSNTMLTNEQSWEQVVCRDYVNGLNLDSLNLPKLMYGILCGGMFVHARREGNYLVCEPGISAVDANKPIPDFRIVLENNWYFRCVTSGENIWNILGSTVPILAPYVLKVPVRFPIAWFKPWDRDYLPNPLTANP